MDSNVVQKNHWGSTELLLDLTAPVNPHSFFHFTSKKHLSTCSLQQQRFLLGPVSHSVQLCEVWVYRYLNRSAECSKYNILQNKWKPGRSTLLWYCFTAIFCYLLSIKKHIKTNTISFHTLPMKDNFLLNNITTTIRHSPQPRKSDILLFILPLLCHLGQWCLRAGL